MYVYPCSRLYSKCSFESHTRHHFNSFFFNDTATTEIYTLSLHDALPISSSLMPAAGLLAAPAHRPRIWRRSEEHTSELQSLTNLVCRLLLEKKNLKKK